MKIPHLFALFQKSARRTAGPKVAPNPPHANETILNTEESGLSAKITATPEMMITEILAIANEDFSESLIWKT